MSSSLIGIVLIAIFAAIVAFMTLGPLMAILTAIVVILVGIVLTKKEDIMISRDKLEDHFYLGIFLIAMLFTLIAIFGLYTSINSLIGMWFDYRYQPIFQILFNLSILAISIYLIRERLINR
jgi:hypothetical protein